MKFGTIAGLFVLFCSIALTNVEYGFAGNPGDERVRWTTPCWATRNIRSSMLMAWMIRLTTERSLTAFHIQLFRDW